MDSGGDLGAPLAVRCERAAGNCGRFSFQSLTFQIIADKPAAKENARLLFSEEVGFNADCDNRHYPATFRGLSGSLKTTRLPDATNLPLQKHYFADGKKTV
jgi:hypothetical protein